MKTTKRAPIFEGEDGILYEKQKQTDALRNPNAFREIVGEGKDAEVRWLVPVGTVHNSNAERARFDKLLGDDKAKAAASQAGPVIPPKAEEQANQANGVSVPANDSKVDAKIKAPVKK